MESSITSPTRRRPQAGMTLVELLVAMTIMSVVTGMIILTWFSLQSSYAQSAAANDARASARDALNQMSLEIRSANARPGSAVGAPVFEVANPTDVQFYSSFNISGQTLNGNATGTTSALRLTRIYLDGTLPYQTLYLVQDTNNNRVLGDSGDVTIQLATNVVNNSWPSTTSTTPIFTYGYRDSSGNFQTVNAISPSATSLPTLLSIISVNIRVVVDANLTHSPTPVDLQTLVRPQNAPNS